VNPNGDLPIVHPTNGEPSHGESLHGEPPNGELTHGETYHGDYGNMRVSVRGQGKGAFTLAFFFSL